MLTGFRDVWKKAIEVYKQKEASLYSTSDESDEHKFDSYEIKGEDE